MTALSTSGDGSRHARLRTGLGGCAHCYPGGQACICVPERAHALHICRNEDCFCHSEERYGQQHTTPVPRAAPHPGHHRRGQRQAALPALRAPTGTVAERRAAHHLRPR